MLGIFPFRELNKNLNRTKKAAMRLVLEELVFVIRAAGPAAKTFKFKAFKDLGF